MPGWTGPNFAPNQSLGTGPVQKFATSCRYQSEHLQSSRLSHAECVQIQLLLRQISSQTLQLKLTIQHTTVLYSNCTDGFISVMNHVNLTLTWWVLSIQSFVLRITDMSNPDLAGHYFVSLNYHFLAFISLYLQHKIYEIIN